jgi:glyoxylase-like metal-dependent hydrolase (beta-lactamase superfamily II)
MDIESFHEPDSGTWTHLLSDPATGSAAVIDPVWVYDPVSGRADSRFIDQVLAAASGAGRRIEWVLETHAHADHLTAAKHVQARTGARLACSRGICAVQRNFIRVFNLSDLRPDGSQFDRLLDEGDTLELGELRLEVIATPGHTSDSITYRVGDAAFIGDTLFAPAFGTARCDFPGGDAGALYDSIMRLYRLPAATRLYLCHDYPADGAAPRPFVTVEQSMRDNIHCRSDTTRAEFEAVRSARDAGLALPRLILPSLQVNIRGGEPPPVDSNGAAYLRIPFNRSIEELIGE